MRFRPATVILCTMLLAAAAESGRTPDREALEATLNRMDQASLVFRAISVNVRRVSHTAVINEDLVDTGLMLIKRSAPKDMKMLIELTEPDPKAVAFQGRKLEIYYPKIQTVQEFDVGKNRDLLDEFFLNGFGTPRKDLENAYAIRFLGQEPVAGQKTTSLELIPKSKEVLQHLKKFELWISDSSGYPVQQRFFLPADDYMLVTYTNMRINPELSDSALKLKLPKGVKREYPQR